MFLLLYLHSNSSAQELDQCVPKNIKLNPDVIVHQLLQVQATLDDNINENTQTE